MTGRLREETLLRAVAYAADVLILVDEMELARRPRRVIDQLIGSGTAPGANLFEAHEAVSKADFVKSLGWASKELSETRFWLLVIAARQWFPPERTAHLLDETVQLLKITKTLIARVRESQRPR